MLPQADPLLLFPASEKGCLAVGWWFTVFAQRLLGGGAPRGVPLPGMSECLVDERCLCSSISRSVVVVNGCQCAFQFSVPGGNVWVRPEVVAVDQQILPAPMGFNDVQMMSSPLHRWMAQ